MRLVFVVAAALYAPGALAQTVQHPPNDAFRTLESTTAWINNYPRTRDFAHAPLAIRAISAQGGLRDIENSGVYVGFIAGLIGSDPDRAQGVLDKMLPVRSEDEWAVVRGIAYSGLPQWKALLRANAVRLSARQTMIADYLNGRTPTLDALAIEPSPSTWQRVRKTFAVDFAGKDKTKPPALEPSQLVLDTLWGYYLANGSYRPLLPIVAMLPWSKDRDNVERLTLGSMAKYSLALNAGRDADLMAKLKAIKASRDLDRPTLAALNDTIDAAERAEVSKLRKDALVAIEMLKAKGPGYKRDVNTWAKVGQGALAVGCVAAAFTGHVEFGLPCVFGGGATSAAMYYVNE
jgi:hypothetical protein